MKCIKSWKDERAVVKEKHSAVNRQCLTHEKAGLAAGKHDVMSATTVAKQSISGSVRKYFAKGADGGDSDSLAPEFVGNSSGDDSDNEGQKKGVGDPLTRPLHLSHRSLHHSVFHLWMTCMIK